MLKRGRFILVMFMALAFVSMATAQAEKKAEPAKPAEVKKLEASVPAKPAPVKKITGSAVAVDKNKITIMTAAGPMVILADEKATTVTYEGKALPLKDLTPKSKITVVYELDATKPLQTAKSIEIKKLEPKEEKK